MFLVPPKDVLAPKEGVRGGRECFFWWWGGGCLIPDGGFARGSMCLAAEEEEEEGICHTMKALRHLHVGPGRHVEVGTIK